MALQKTIMSPSGVEAQYHKIITLSVDRRDEKANVSIGCFKDLQSRQSNKEPLMTKHIKLDISGLNHIQPMFPQIYEMIKLHPDFINSNDV